MQAQPVIAPRRGRPLKPASAPDTEKKRLNRERVARHKAKVANEVSGVVEDFIDCDDERKVLKANVKTLSAMLKKCDEQIATLMSDVNKMGKPTKKAPSTTAKMASASTIVGAIKGKIARNKMKEADKDLTFDLLTRDNSFKM